MHMCMLYLIHREGKTLCARCRAYYGRRPRAGEICHLAHSRGFLHFSDIGEARDPHGPLGFRGISRSASSFFPSTNGRVLFSKVRYPVAARLLRESQSSEILAWMQHLCVEGWLDLGEILQYRPRIPANSEIRHPPIHTIMRRGVGQDETSCLVTGAGFRLLVL